MLLYDILTWCFRKSFTFCLLFKVLLTLSGPNVFIQERFCLENQACHDIGTWKIENHIDYYNGRGSVLLAWRDCVN